jgi:hypothetical protein
MIKIGFFLMPGNSATIFPIQQGATATPFFYLYRWGRQWISLPALRRDGPFSVSSGNGEKASRIIILKRRPVPLFFAGFILSHHSARNGRAFSMLIRDKSGWMSNDLMELKNP